MKPEQAFSLALENHRSKKRKNFFRDLLSREVGNGFPMNLLESDVEFEIEEEADKERVEASKVSIEEARIRMEEYSFQKRQEGRLRRQEERQKARLRRQEEKKSSSDTFVVNPTNSAKRRKLL